MEMEAHEGIDSIRSYCTSDSNHEDLHCACNRFDISQLSGTLLVNMEQRDELGSIIRHYVKRIANHMGNESPRFCQLLPFFCKQKGEIGPQVQAEMPC